MTDQELAVKMAEIDQRSKSNTHRINELAAEVNAINRLVTAVEVMATEQKHQSETMAGIKNDVASLDAKVDVIEKKPAKRWEGVVEKIIYGVVGALVTIAAAALFGSL